MGTGGTPRRRSPTQGCHRSFTTAVEATTPQRGWGGGHWPGSSPGRGPCSPSPWRSGSSNLSLHTSRPTVPDTTAGRTRRTPRDLHALPDDVVLCGHLSPSGHGPLPQDPAELPTSVVYRAVCPHCHGSIGLPCLGLSPYLPQPYSPQGLMLVLPAPAGGNEPPGSGAPRIANDLTRDLCATWPRPAQGLYCSTEALS